MGAQEIISIIWAIVFGAVLLAPLFNAKPEKRFYGEGSDEEDRPIRH